MADGQPISITEIGGDNRVVRLEGPSLPDRGSLDLGGETKAIDIWYPGAKAASIQFLGTKEAPVTLRGRLIDVWAGVSGYALATMRAMEALRYAQARVRLEWGDTVQKVGYIKSSSFLIFRESDIQYEIEIMILQTDSDEVLEQPRIVSNENYALDELNQVDPIIAAGREALEIGYTLVRRAF